MNEICKFRSRMPASAEEVYRFHAEPDALERLAPPWERTRAIARTGSIEQRGSRTTLRVSIGPISQTWIAEHTDCVPGRMFRDVMISGPFRLWQHTHEFQPETPHSSWLEDRIEYQLPLGWLGKLVAGSYIRRRLQRMFEWRHKATAEILTSKRKGGTGVM